MVALRLRSGKGAQRDRWIVMRRYRKTIALGALSFLCVTLIGALINIVTGRLPPETPYLDYALPALAVAIAAGVGLYVWQERAERHAEHTADPSQASGAQTNAQESQGFVNQASGPIAQNFGEQTNIATGGGIYVDTGGGAYAEGDIDKRQGSIFVEGDLYGNLIGQQVVQPSLLPALRQLRAPVGDFVGREREIEQLVQALSKTGNAAAAISGVRGMGGIGKTELAYTVAQRLAAQFPDAQLLIELHGASSNPLAAEQALQTVIRAFEREAKLPDDLGQLKGLYNAVLSGKRALILADDAHDAAQVRPLLPPQGCALLVTSRNHFELQGMETCDLRTLPKDEAEKLLLKICSRIDTAAPELARLCGYLPLALWVSASLLKSRSSRRVATYLKKLGDERTKLEHLRDPHDPMLDVEASLRLSYEALEAAAQIALCQLSAFPTSFDRDAAQNVVEVLNANEIDDVLEELCLLSLLEWDDVAERYSLHDLVRAFVAARLEDGDTVRLRHARHYAWVAKQAEQLYMKGGVALLVGLALFDCERTHIDAGWAWAMGCAGNQDADALLLCYADATVYVGDLRYDMRRERIPQLEAQQAAALRLERRDRESAALGNLGNAYYVLGDMRQAIAFHEQALIIDRELGDRRGESTALGSLGNAYADLGDARQAITFYEQALEIAHEIGDRRGESTALSNLGNAYADLEDVRQAITFYEQRLKIAHEIGDRRGESTALSNLGNAYADLGHARQAITFYEQALAIGRELGDRRGESIVSWNLGETLAKHGELARAAALMRVCVDYERKIGHPDAEKDAVQLEHLRQRLAAEPGAAPAEQDDEG